MAVLENLIKLIEKDDLGVPLSIFGSLQMIKWVFLKLGGAKLMGFRIILDDSGGTPIFPKHPKWYPLIMSK